MTLTSSIIVDSASADLYPPVQSAQGVVQDNLPTVAQALARGGNIASIPGAVCDATCQSAYAANGDLNQGQPEDADAGKELFAEHYTLMVSLGVIEDIGVGTALGLGSVAAVGGVLYLSLRNAGKDRELPLEPPEPRWQTPVAQNIRLLAAGSSLYTGLVMPNEAWVWEWLPPSGGQFRRQWVEAVAFGQSTACPPAANPPADAIPRRMTVLNGVPHPNCGSYNVCQALCDGGVAHAAVISTRDLIAGMVQDYLASNPHVNPDYLDPIPNAPANRQALIDRTADLLQTGDYGLVVAWYAHVLSPRCHANPVNPSESVVPAPLQGETTSHYLSCLSRLGVSHSANYLSYVDANVDLAPGEVVDVSPQTGGPVTSSSVVVTGNPEFSGKLKDTADALSGRYPALAEPVVGHETQTQAAVIAQSCLKSAGKSRGLTKPTLGPDPAVADDACGIDPAGLPIFVPGNGAPLEATVHDQIALGLIGSSSGAWPGWMKETYVDRPRTNWTWTYPQTDDPGGPKCKGAQPVLACDELPFAKTLEGGPDTSPTGKLPHLKLISWGSNSSEGGFWNGFLNNCNLKKPPALQGNHSRSVFLIVPVPLIPTQTSICNANLA